MRTKKLLMSSIGLMTALFMMSSCNNEANDSVAKADSINRDTREVADSLNRSNQPDENSSRFLVRAANNGQAEVLMAKLATERGTRKDVKDIAAMLVTDHNAVGDQVKYLAQQRNVTLPDSISQESKKDYDDLVAKRGTEFDKKFVNQMIDDHQDDINLFEGILNETNDAEVKTFAQNTLPKLREHLELLKKTKDGMK